MKTGPERLYQRGTARVWRAVEPVRAAELVFVDTGAWIALALTRDPAHARARHGWDQLLGAGARAITIATTIMG